MDNIKTIYINLPPQIRSFVIVCEDNFYTIVLNSRLSAAQNFISYQHEINHIKNGDFQKECCVDIIEQLAHM